MGKTDGRTEITSLKLAGTNFVQKAGTKLGPTKLARWSKVEGAKFVQITASLWGTTKNWTWLFVEYTDQIRSGSFSGFSRKGQNPENVGPRNSSISK